MRIRGRVIENFNAGKAIKKYFHIQTVFMILMTCLLARVIYENYRINYKLEEVQKHLLECPCGRGDARSSRNYERADYYGDGTIQSNPNADYMERRMNEMEAGEERFINGYRVRKIK